MSTPVPFTLATLKARFPEFTGETQERFDALQGMALDFVSQDVLGDKFTSGWILYTAHLLTRTAANLSGVVGPVTGERVGDLSRTYAGTMGKTDLDSTKYGIMFKQLISNLGLGAGGAVQDVFPDPDRVDGLPA